MNFKSFLKEEFVQYILWRKNLGFKTVSDYDNLAVFDNYLWQKKIKSLNEITYEFFIEMIDEELETRLPQTINHRICVLNNFFKYLKRIEKITENPLQEIESKEELFYSPATFTVEEIKTILNHFSKNLIDKPRNKAFFLSRLSRYTAFHIQAHCGLRISEVCKLKISDYNSTKQTLYIRKTKFRKDREIPISECIAADIENYLSVRHSLLSDDQSPSLLLTHWKGPWDRKTLDHYFRKALNELGLYKKQEIKGDIIFGSPSTHSLRHSFAVNTVRRWLSLEYNINQIGHILAAYMGHVDFTCTQIYLKALSHSPFILIFKHTTEEQYEQLTKAAF